MTQSLHNNIEILYCAFQGFHYALPMADGWCYCTDDPYTNTDLPGVDPCPGNIAEYCGNAKCTVFLDTGVGK